MGACRHNQAFALIEILTVVVILAIAATLSMNLIAATDANLRADRAARECQTALRVARSLALTSGNTCGVRFDTSTKRFWVWQNGTPATPINTSLTSGGTYIIDLVNTREVSGVGMAVSIPTDGTNPYDVQYSALGVTVNKGTATFSFGGISRVVTIPVLGDPTIN